MRAGKHVIADKYQAFVAEPIANHLTAIVLHERTKIVRVDNLHFDTLCLNNTTLEPTPIDPLAYFVTANVQRLRQQRYREPFPALADPRPNRCSMERTDAGGRRRIARPLRRNIVNQFDQTLLLPCGPLAITALFGHAETAQETQARAPRVP